jgi:hypothetical protein
MIIPFRHIVDYRFKGGTVGDLLALAANEYHDSCRNTCKTCGRGLPEARATAEHLYTCSARCERRINTLLVVEDDYPSYTFAEM